MITSKTYRVMVVDDDPDIRLMVRETLSDRYEVVECSHGQQAVHNVETCDPDMIIMDLRMPGLNGFETCRAIRRIPRFTTVYVIFLSAYGTRENISKTFESGGNTFLTKPIDPARLRKNVDVYFDRTPPPPRPKKFTMQQLQGAMRRDREQQAQRQQQSLSERTSAEKAKSEATAYASSTEQSARHWGANRADPGKRPRILIVEDDQELVDVMTLSLQQYFEVVSASDGLEAANKIMRYQPDIILTDIMMPKVNGYRLCETVRENPALADTKIIVATAKVSSRDRDHAYRSGADVFLPKPFDIEELVEVCQRVASGADFKVHDKAYDINTIRAVERDERRARTMRKSRFDRLADKDAK